MSIFIGNFLRQSLIATPQSRIRSLLTSKVAGAGDH
jgi:hypothetical protein